MFFGLWAVCVAVPFCFVAARTAHHVVALLRLAYFDAVRRPVAHSFLGFHPRSPRLTPARTVEDAHLYAQLACRLQCRTQVLPPQAALKFVLAERLAFPRFFPPCAIANVCCQKRKCNAVVFHPLQVCHHTFGVNMFVHPIIVASYADAVRRCEKRLPQLFVRI